MEFMFNVPGKVFFGEGYAKQTGQYLKDVNVTKVMCVYDKGVKGAGIVDGIVESIKSEGIEVIEFDGVLPDPPATMVDEAGAIARREKVDGVVGIGGGSSMDTAKCINILLGNPGNILDYSSDYDTVQNKGKYLLLIPTTFGTGSETTDGGVLSVPEENKKVSIWGKNIGADLAIIDPELALGIPKSITAATGMDSLSHAVESYMSMMATPITEAIAIEAIKLILEYLPKAVEDGKNIKNRSGMCMGCFTAGITFNNAYLNQGHGLAHPMGAYWHLPHGTACAIALPFSIKDNAEAMPEKVRKLGELLGLKIPEGISNEELGSMVSAAVIDFSKGIGIPNLKELGVDAGLIKTVAEAVKSEPDQYTYPHIPETEDIIAFLENNYNE